MDTFVVLIALALFLAIVVYAGGHKAILGGLDSRAQKIAAELDEAKRLRGEAEKLLAEYEQKRVAAEAEARQIVADAQAEAERIRADQEAKLADFVARRTKMAEQKIAQAEASAAAEVKAAAADAAVQAAEAILRGQATGKLADDLITAGLGEVKQRLN